MLQGQPGLQAQGAEAGLAAQLAVGALPLLALLLGSGSGQEALLGDADAAALLLDALDPGSMDRPAPSSWEPEPATQEPEAAAALRHAIVARVALHDLLQPMGTPLAAPLRALRTLRLLAVDGSTAARQAALLALAIGAPGSIQALLQLAAAHCRMLRIASGAGTGADEAPDSPRSTLDAAPGAADAVALLSALCDEAHADVLGRWRGHAERVLGSISAMLASLGPCSTDPGAPRGLPFSGMLHPLGLAIHSRLVLRSPRTSSTCWH